MAAKKISGKDALVRVLTKNGGGPMPSKELIAAALKLATDMRGKTPAATLSAMLATENAKKDGMFIRTAPATYKLRAAKPATAKEEKPAKVSPGRAEKEAESRAAWATGKVRKPAEEKAPAKSRTGVKTG